MSFTEGSLPVTYETRGDQCKGQVSGSSFPCSGDHAIGVVVLPIPQLLKEIKGLPLVNFLSIAILLIVLFSIKIGGNGEEGGRDDGRRTTQPDQSLLKTLRPRGIV